VQVTLWYFAGCPNWQLADRRLRDALREIHQADADVRLVAVETDAEAAASGFAGSPTFTVDGVDLFDDPTLAGALTCRVYRTVQGLSGVPETADLAAALLEKVTT
jgi:hypothetical protein